MPQIVGLNGANKLCSTHCYEAFQKKHAHALQDSVILNFVFILGRPFSHLYMSPVH